MRRTGESSLIPTIAYKRDTVQAPPYVRSQPNNRITRTSAARKKLALSAIGCLVSATAASMFGDRSAVRRHRASQQEKESRKMSNVLDLVDQTFFRLEGAAGVAQTVWVYNRPVDIDGLRRFHDHLQHGRLSRRIERSPLRFGRHRWVSPSDQSDLEIVATPRPREEFDAWLGEQANTPLDAERGPGWHLAVLPFTDGGAGVSLVLSHCVTDGGGGCLGNRGSGVRLRPLLQLARCRVTPAVASAARGRSPNRARPPRNPAGPSSPRLDSSGATVTVRNQPRLPRRPHRSPEPTNSSRCQPQHSFSMPRSGTLAHTHSGGPATACSRD